MTWVEREIPRGSGRWTCVNEPGRPHPREAPQFECSLCGRVIGKSRSLVLREDCGNKILCLRCDMSPGAHAKLYPACPERWHDTGDHHAAFGTRAGIAVHLGIWPGKPDASKVTFRQWLKQFTGEQTAIGDLARDIYKDRRWPRGPGSSSKYLSYLEDMEACDAAIGTLREAWERYEREAGR
jgi:uncharacterized protein YozE (UPF0346 family)